MAKKGKCWIFRMFSKRFVSQFHLFVAHPVYLVFFFNGVVRSRYKRLGKLFLNDFLKNKKHSLREKIWAYKRGFIAERIARYNLTENNYKNYMSDIGYYKWVSYKNQRFLWWLDDKLTTWYVLAPFVQYLPTHFYSIVNRQTRQLFVDGNKTINTLEGIIILLEKQKELAVKPIRGSKGKGFFKLSFENNSFYINNSPTTKDELLTLFKELNDHVFTEYIHAHDKLKTVYDKTPNTIRIYTIYDDTEGAQVTSAFIRFGTSGTGYVDNISEGGVYCGVNPATGKTFRPLINIAGHATECTRHPDTGYDLNGLLIPNWGLIVSELVKISNYINNTPYLGFDVVTTNDGFKILEINSHGDIDVIQSFFPLYDNPYQRKLFAR